MGKMQLPPDHTPDGIDLSGLAGLMAEAGVFRLYAKVLSENDNSKNQVYLGMGFEAINIIPNGGVYSDPGSKNQILKSDISFSWINLRGQLHPAPNAQLILYPQYPEIRMSGFLKGCREAPSDIMRVREQGRALFIGIKNDGAVIGYAAAAGSPLANELVTRTDLAELGVFREIPLSTSGAVGNNREMLLAGLGRIHRLGWVTSKRLRPDGSPGPCSSSNCGGYTLEAELGVTPNGYSEPDFLGWEVKQHNSPDLNQPELSTSPITLMTPEPTGGFYRDAGVEAFVRRFGYPDTKGRPDRLNFGGIFRNGSRAGRTGLTLALDGFDATAGKIENLSGGITLFTDSGEAAAVWGYAALIGHWTRKHAMAVYVPSQFRKDPARQYRFGHLVRLGEKTDFLFFLKAMARGSVYYDPGIKIEGESTSRPVIKRRSQFRIKSEFIFELYKTMTTEAVT